MSSKSLIAPLSSLRVSSHQIPAHGGIPNTSIQKKPVLIYHSCFQNASASQIECTLPSPYHSPSPP